LRPTYGAEQNTAESLSTKSRLKASQFVSLLAVSLGSVSYQRSFVKALPLKSCSTTGRNGNCNKFVGYSSGPSTKATCPTSLPHRLLLQLTKEEEQKKETTGKDCPESEGPIIPW